MRRISLIALSIAALVTTCAHAETRIRIKGSDTIGGKLAPEMAEVYRLHRPDVSFTIGALGSGTAFVGLFDDSCDIGPSSRPVNEGELVKAKELGVSVRELVIGYDGLAVVVHPSNPVKDLDIPTLSRLFTGAVKSWKEVGGTNAPVRVITRPPYSGTHSFFKEKVVRRGNAKGPEEFSPNAETMEENGEILAAVASDPNAIAYVGLGWLKPSVKALGVKPRPNEPGIVPSFEVVRSGKYPLYRPLFLYMKGTPSPEVAAFLKFFVSEEGARLVAKNGFVPPDAPGMAPSWLASIVTPPLPPAATRDTAARTAAAPAPTAPPPAAAPAAAAIAPAAAAPAAAAPAASTPPSRPRYRINFAVGSTSLSGEGKKAVAEIGTKLEETRTKALITGHADASGPVDANRRIAKARARSVADALAALGIPRDRIVYQASGSEEPVASNETPSGRAENRRVDVEILRMP